jgi:hypothetical protein
MRFYGGTPLRLLQAGSKDQAFARWAASVRGTLHAKRRKPFDKYDVSRRARRAVILDATAGVLFVSYGVAAVAQRFETI